MLYVIGLLAALSVGGVVGARLALHYLRGRADWLES